MTSIKIPYFALAIALFLSAGCSAQPENVPSVNYDLRIFGTAEGPEIQKIEEDDEYWREKLSPQEFYILREEGTERPFTGEYDGFKGDGIYCCAACGLPLFDSEHKFDSRTGWPSYTQPLAPGVIAYKEDRSLGMLRVEVVCARCGGHQGHVFEDGPRPTGLRYCINSAAMKFIERENASPVLRELGID